MNVRFLFSITTITGLLMPSFFYAMAPARRSLPSLMTRISEEGERSTVTLVPKKESFVIAPDKKIGDCRFNQIAMDQGSDGQLLAVSVCSGARNVLIYAINPQKKTWQLIHRSDDGYDMRAVRVCDDSIFIAEKDKIIRWDAATKKCENMLTASPCGYFSDFALEKDARGRKIAVAAAGGMEDTIVMDIDAQRIINRISHSLAWTTHCAITHLSSGDTVYAESSGDKIILRIAADKQPFLVINKAHDNFGEVFLYEDIHKRPTLISYYTLDGTIDIYDARTGALYESKRINGGGNFEFRKKDGRVLMAISRRNSPKVELFDISDRDAWKLVTTCAVNDAQWYKKALGMHIDDFGYPHLASITQQWGNHQCWPLQLWEPKERAQTLAQIKAALQTHLAPEGIAHTILGYAGSAEHAHAIDRYNAPQQQSEQQEVEIPIAPIGTEGLSEGRLQLHEGPPPAHPSWFVRNQKWLNWVALGCSIVPLVMLVAAIIKNRRG